MRPRGPATSTLSGITISMLGALIAFVATLALIKATTGCSPHDDGGGPDLGNAGPPAPPASNTASSSGNGAGDSPNLPTGPLNNGCAPEGHSGHQTVKCLDGTTFDVEVSEKCVRGGCGVILDVHGWSMTGPMEDRHTRLNDLAVPKGYVVIQPTAPGSPPSWAADKPTGRDFKFDETVWGFFEATMQRFGANRDRVHMTGFSQGSMMTFRFFYAHGDTFASIAPIAGPDGFVFPKNAFASIEITGKPPPKRIPILYTHGTKDRLLSFDRTAIPLREEILKAYELSTVAPEVIKNEPAFRASRWRAADDGRTLFEFWEHDFSQGDIYIGGHCLSGPIKEGDGEFRKSEVPFRCLNEKKPQGQYDLGLEILRFFEEHPRGK